MYKNQHKAQSVAGVSSIKQSGNMQLCLTPASDPACQPVVVSQHFSSDLLL